MRKILITLTLLFFLIISTLIYAQSFWGGKTLSAQEVKLKWGNEKFDIKKFRAGDYSLKAKMSYSIMTDKTLKGKTYEEIRELF